MIMSDTSSHIMLLLLLLVGFSPAAWCYGSGKVASSCDDMLPDHGVEAQTGPAPYAVIVDRSSFSPGDQVTVQLLAKGSSSFKGFLLKATEVGSQAAVGSFTVPANAQLLSCSEKPNSAVSHASLSAKTSIQVTWTPDASGSGKAIQFSATFVQSKSVFWEAVKSSVLTCAGDCIAGPTETGPPAIVKAHGVLMLIAWMVTGSLGMIVSRYMKEMFNGQLFGKDVWFVIHVLLMGLTVAATIVSFIIIFAHVQGWSGGAHPVLGCLIMILSFIQPISALMRRGPRDTRRCIFNWTHSVNAVVLKVFAVAAISTGLQLISGSYKWMLKVMIGFILWESFLYMFMEASYKWKMYFLVVESKMANLLLLGVLFMVNVAYAAVLVIGIGML